MNSPHPAPRIGGNSSHSCTALHAALARRILRIDEQVWERFLESYHRTLESDRLDDRLIAMQRCWAACSPHATSLLLEAKQSCCPMCLTTNMAPLLSRRSGETYGLCANCGHGLLLNAPISSNAYSATEYYQRRDQSGVGYDAYSQEREYREAKAARLFDWIAGRRNNVRSLLEVGSAYGFSRAAAEQRGWRTMGIDLNPTAALAARELYRFETFTGTLQEAVETGAIKPCEWDIVLYQFVLEHIADPIAELKLAAVAASPQGCVVALVPSMQAVERVIFGASYRSFRLDHLHLFSWKSLDRCLVLVGLRRTAWKSECNVHLLAGFLTDEELQTLYGRGDGPDLSVIAVNEAS